MIKETAYFAGKVIEQHFLLIVAQGFDIHEMIEIEPVYFLLALRDHQIQGVRNLCIHTFIF
jgi:hypothetical protein